MTTMLALRTIMRAASMRRVTAPALTTFLALSLSGCGSLYLHSDSAQQATAKAQSDLDKVDVAAVFSNETAYLNALHDRERDAIAAQFGAQRDADLLKFLYGSTDATGLDGVALLRTRIDGYLKAIAGKTDDVLPKSPKLWRMVDAAYDAPGDVTLAASLEKEFVPRAEKLPDSSEVVSLPSPSGLSLADALKAIHDDEADLKRKQEDADKAKKELAERLKSATETLSGDKSSVHAFDEAAEQINKLLTDANPYIRKYASEALSDSLKKLIDATLPFEEPAGDAVPSDLRASLGFVRATLGVGDAFSDPPKVPHPNTLAAARAWLRYVAGDANFELSQTRARHALHQAEAAAVATQIYYLSRASESLSQVPATKLAFNEGLGKFLSDRAHSQAAVASLQYYADAWTRGFIPAQQLRHVEEPLATRRFKLTRSQQAADAWLGTLKPGVATLAAYGAGGIDPHVIAELLQAVGLGAIAVGVN